MAKTQPETYDTKNPTVTDYIRSNMVKNNCSKQIYTQQSEVTLR